MENNELFQTIERLKESLSDIESARRQVSDTVAAYSNTQKEIGSYANKLNAVETALKDLISLIKNDKIALDLQASKSIEKFNSSCETIIAETESKLSATANTFSNASDASVSKMKEQLKLFDETIEKAGTLKDEITVLTASVKNIQSELSTSQKAQDAAIANIGAAQKDMATQMASTDNTINGIVSTLTGQNNSLSQLSQALSNVSSSLTQLSASLQSAKDVVVQNVNSVQSKLSQQIISLDSSTNEKHTELTHKVGKLQTLIIIQLVISIILGVLMFVLN